MAENAPTSTAVSRKRSYEESESVLTFDVSDRRSEETHLPTPTSPAASNTSADPREQSPMPGDTESSVLSVAKTLSSSGAPYSGAAPATTDRPSKKRKLAFAEKEVERAMEASGKETMKRKSAEVALAKEQEKLAKDEERRRKAEEKELARRQREVERAEKEKVKGTERQAKDEARRRKEEEKRVKEAEKQAKEDAKRRKEEEKSKQEKSQLRLASFFGKPKTSKTREGSVSPLSRRSSVASHGGVEDCEDPAESKLSPMKRTKGKNGFLPFFVMQHVGMAPVNRFAKGQDLQDIAVSRLDRCMHGDSASEPQELTFAFKARKRKLCQKPPRSMKELVDKIQGTSATPTDMTSQAMSVFELSDIPYKILSFAEDVRPPYKGTYTRAVPPNSALKLSRSPFIRQLPDTDYDYDSEAEWEPPNEGDEDLNSGDDESDAGEEGDEEMDGFLDDEDDRGSGRRKQVLVGGGDMMPISSGLCWANANDEKGPLEEYRMQPLSDHLTFPIDPFSTAYWPKPQQTALLVPNAQATMQPPARAPLSSLNPHRSANAARSSSSTKEKSSDRKAHNDSRVLDQASVLDGTQPTVAATAAVAAAMHSSLKPVRCVPDDVLPVFKSAVEGSELTKAGLVEVLKKQFPKLSKDTIKHTLGQVAVRQGVREADKKWVLAATSVDSEGRHWTWRPGATGASDGGSLV